MYDGFLEILVGLGHNVSMQMKLIFLFLQFFFFANTLFSNESGCSVSSFLVYSSDEGIKWVEQCIERYPEILWLADNNVRKTEEGQASSQASYSEQLFGRKYVEFDRTIMTLHCLKLVLDGSQRAYEEFTFAQKDNKLTKESFYTLHLQGQRILHSHWQDLSSQQIAETMLTALVLKDMGKCETARKIFKKFGVSAPDQDDYYHEAMTVLEKYPDLCPSFACLSPKSKELLFKTSGIAHYGHITHLEGGTEIFLGLQESGIAYKDPIALSFDLFVHTCDVAGALGHVNHRSSLAYTELTHKALQATGEAVRVLSNQNMSVWDAYQAYVQIRADWLGLDASDANDRVLVRVGAMLRLFTPEEGIILKQAMQQFDPQVRQRIVAQLDVPEGILEGRTPTYMPALLVNLSNNTTLGRTKEERLFKAVLIGLPFIARVLERCHEMLKDGEFDPNIPLNFNQMAGVAKTSPELLESSFCIDQEGNVLLK